MLRGPARGMLFFGYQSSQIRIFFWCVVQHCPDAAGRRIRCGLAQPSCMLGKQRILSLLRLALTSPLEFAKNPHNVTTISKLLLLTTGRSITGIAKLLLEVGINQDSSLFGGLNIVYVSPGPAICNGVPTRCINRVKCRAVAKWHG